MEEENNAIVVLRHALFIGIILFFIYQTYLILAQLTYTKEYLSIAAGAFAAMCYYCYKIFKRKKDRTEETRAFIELSKRIRNEDHSEQIKYIKPKEPEFTTDIDRIDVRINLDLDKKIFFGKDLNIEEKNYLKNHKYEKGNFVPIDKSRQEEVWVRKNMTESLEHTFLVQNIKLELQKYTKDIEINVSEKPDIIFKNKKGELVAIEVETGLSYERHKDRLNQKFFELKKRYKNSVIVLTNNKVKYRYEKINNGVKIILRADIPSFIRRHFPVKDTYTSGDELGRQKG